MLEYIKGMPAEVTPAYAVIDNNGLGYGVNITLIDYPHIAAAKEPVKLYLYEAIREDAHILYGFLDKESRELFLLLITVSGVGPNTARLILSSMTAKQLEGAIAAGNDAQLKAVKGIGGKTAQRIIVDLKDKIKGVSGSLITSTPAGETYQDALDALVALGYTQQQSRKVLSKIFADTPSASTEDAIRQAFKML